MGDRDFSLIVTASIAVTVSVLIAHFAIKAIDNAAFEAVHAERYDEHGEPRP